MDAMAIGPWRMSVVGVGSILKYRFVFLLLLLTAAKRLPGVTDPI